MGESGGSGTTQVKVFRRISVLAIVIGIIGFFCWRLWWVVGAVTDGFIYVNIGISGPGLAMGIWNIAAFTMRMPYFYPSLWLVLAGIVLAGVVGVVALLVAKTRSNALISSILHIVAGTLTLTFTVLSIVLLDSLTGAVTIILGSTYTGTLYIGVFAYAEVLVGILILILGLYLARESH